MSDGEQWYDAHEPGRPTPPGYSYSVLMNFITPEMAGAFLAIADEAPDELFVTGQRVAPGYSRLDLLKYLKPDDERMNFIREGHKRMTKEAFCFTDEWRDAWLLRYVPGAGIRDHVDPVPGRDSAPCTRYRLNALLTPESNGGELYIEGRHVPLRQFDAALFASGSLIHRVEPTIGTRYVLSLAMLGPKGMP